MYQGQSTVKVFCLDQDLTGATVYMDIKTITGEVITKEEPDLLITVENGVTSITLVLTQEDTLNLPEGVCQVQTRWIDQDGNCDCTDVATFDVKGILNRRLITYKGGEPDEY